MVLVLGNKPEPELTAKLRKKEKTTVPLRRAFSRLKAQWGLDAKGVTLNIETSESMRPGNVGGSFDPNINTITLFTPFIRSAAERRFAGTAGRSPESLMQAVLRHEFAHAMQMNREARTGVADDQIDPSGLRVYGGNTEGGHGMTFNRLNVSLQGIGSEVEMDNVGLPPEFANLLDQRRDF